MHSITGGNPNGTFGIEQVAPYNILLLRVPLDHETFP
jgi:hypothetical protein